MASSHSSSFIILSIFVTMILLGKTSSNIQQLSYSQKFDHIGVGGPYENATFQQRVIIDFTYWAGAENNGSILVFLGAETTITESVGHIGVITEAAPRLRALVIYIEHRFYGTSVPLGSIDKAFGNPIIRSYLSCEQALTDFAEVVVSIKTNLSALNSPVIVLGGSYGGMLAAWFRLKYPSIAMGALASSAPVLFYQDDTSPDHDFCTIVTQDFEHVNHECSEIIRLSWIMIDEIALTANGLPILANKFNVCGSLSSVHELKLFIARLYSFVAQYNGRFNEWINSVCDPILEATNENAVDRVARAVSVANRGGCAGVNNMGLATPFQPLDEHSQKAWDWQVCTELAINRGCNGDNPILPRDVFYTRAEYMESCQADYFLMSDSNKVRPLYTIEDIRSGSNIIFSNGLMDPISSFGIVDDLSHTIVAITTKQGSHCLDVNPALEDDPKWLRKQRQKEIELMERWINHGARETISVKCTSVFQLLLVMLVCLGYIF